MKRHTIIDKLKKECGAPENAEDASERWEGTLTAQLMINDKPMRGRLELLTTHIVLCTQEGSLLASIPLTTILSLQRKKEVHFPTRSFADEPLFRSLIEMSTTNGDAVITIEGSEGIHVCKAMEKLWCYTNDALTSEREMAMFRSYKVGDTLHALSLLPLDVECVLAQQIAKGGQINTIDRPVVLRIEENFTFSIIFRPDDIHDAHNLKAMSLPLDDVMLIWAKGDDIRICLDDGRILLATSIVNSATAVKSLLCVFLSNAATMVYRTMGTDKTISAFGYEEAWKLFQHYCFVDTDLDGSISQTEFLISIGPILGSEKALPKALYDLFDCFGHGKIRMFEYLYGCRVLLKGDVDDRLHYLFYLFDTKRNSSINYQQFLDGLKILSAAITLKIPRGETIETFSFRLFEEIDTNGNNDIDFDEFSRALTGNIGVIDALESIAEQKASQGPSKVVSFGHPQWHQITQILAGIQLAVSHPDANKAVDNGAFSAKLTYNCNSGMQFGKESTHNRSLLKLGKAEEVIFNDYCPAVFHAIRGRFGISDEDYLHSLGVHQLKRNLLFGCLTSLFEMSSSGRSGSFFYASHDNRYILKTIPAAESATLRRILPQYYDHVMKNEDTFLTRFCGLHALIKGGQKVIFVVMSNIFLNKVPILETYDLKGSTVNRSTPMAQRGAGVALKDNDFDTKRLYVSAPMKKEIMRQVEADSYLLSQMNLNDYSFLLGIHYSDTTLDATHGGECPKPQYSSFQQFYGGIGSASRTEVYYIGIIDTLTDYGLKKMGEHLSKSVIYDGKAVSCIPPLDYQKRFVDYLDSIIVTNM